MWVQGAQMFPMEFLCLKQTIIHNDLEYAIQVTCKCEQWDFREGSSYQKSRRSKSEHCLVTILKNAAQGFQLWC